jgi:hypothetical protein
MQNKPAEKELVCWTDGQERSMFKAKSPSLGTVDVAAVRGKTYDMNGKLTSIRVSKSFNEFPDLRTVSLKSSYPFEIRVLDTTQASKVRELILRNSQ